MGLKVISFDLDGTLIDQTFVNGIWFEGLPTLYAKSHNIDFDNAKKILTNEYDKVGMEKLEWYDIKYWFKKFLNSKKWEPLFESMRSRVKLYPEVPKVLKDFREVGYNLIIISNSAREFLNFELEHSGINRYFKHIFSSTSDFREVKKKASFYSKICKLLKISPLEVAHVGDNWKFDFETPRSLGIAAYYLDRSKKRTGKLVVHNLEEFSGIINSI